MPRIHHVRGFQVFDTDDHRLCNCASAIGDSHIERAVDNIMSCHGISNYQYSYGVIASLLLLYSNLRRPRRRWHGLTIQIRRAFVRFMPHTRTPISFRLVVLIPSNLTATGTLHTNCMFPSFFPLVISAESVQASSSDIGHQT